MTKANYPLYESVLPNLSRLNLAQNHSDSNIGSYTTLNNNNGGGTYKNQVGDTDEDVLVIGVDFGTTCSGVAWATVADFASDTINLISWPYSGQEEGKVPTELHYENGQIMWGYDIPLEVEPVRWFKLLLVKEEDLSAELRQSESLIRARRYLRQTRKTAVDLIADYLRALFQHTLHTIHKARGESVVDALRFHVVITVPAIWKDYARQGMEQAARLAGIMDFRPAGQTTLTFAPEPEAAALSTLCEPGRNPKKGEVFIICDAGGGTVDLISYEVTNSKPLAIEEAVEGTGRLCGGIFIDEAFETACKDRLVRQWSHLSPTGVKEIMKKWEEGVKSQFNPGYQHKEYPIGIPAEAFKASTSSLTDISREPVIKNGRIHFQEQGEVVSKKDPVRHNFYELFRNMDEFDGKLRVTLETCDALEPPERKDFQVKSQSKFQLKVAAKFSELPDFRTESGATVKKLAYEIEMIPSGASLDIAVYMNGKKLGSQNASARFE
ncbi:hsp70 family chaperone [Colletotrichum camelliae]|nr:hsp70 family chaperone [Colletotrichum camelliae]